MTDEEFLLLVKEWRALDDVPSDDRSWVEKRRLEELTLLLQGAGYDLKPCTDGPRWVLRETMGLWRASTRAPEGKYLVQRRDGSVVEWPLFVLGARDPAAR